MKTKYTTLMIRIDRVTVDSLLEVTGLAVKHRVPPQASVSIRTDGTGTHIIFEWVDEPKLKPGDPSPWTQKPYKPF